MWWDEFERRLTDAFITYDKHEKRSVHSDNKKLRILHRKINAEFLQATKSSINIEHARTPVNLSYDDDLAVFRNQVNQKYPPELSTSNNRRPRTVNEVDSMGSGRGGLFQGRGRGHYGGRGGYDRGGIFYGERGRGGRYGRGGRQNSGYKRSIPDDRMVQCNDGMQIVVHPAYDFTADEWFRLPEAKNIWIRGERTQYKRSRRNDDKTVVRKTTTGGVQEYIRSIEKRISAIELNTGDGQSRASGSIMGGRNKQEKMRSRNNGNDRSVRAVNVKRIYAQVTTGGYDIEDPEPGNISVNELDTNADTCCLGSNFTVLKMTSRTADLYP